MWLLQLVEEIDQCSPNCRQMLDPILPPANSLLDPPISSTSDTMNVTIIGCSHHDHWGTWGLVNSPFPRPHCHRVIVIITISTWGLVNSPFPRPRFPTARIKSSSIVFLLEPRLVHDLQLVNTDDMNKWMWIFSLLMGHDMGR